MAARNERNSFSSSETMTRTFVVTQKHEYEYQVRKKNTDMLTSAPVDYDTLPEDHPDYEWIESNWTDTVTAYVIEPRDDSDVVCVRVGESDNSLTLYDEGDIDAYIQLLSDIKAAKVFDKKSE